MKFIRLIALVALTLTATVAQAETSRGTANEIRQRAAVMREARRLYRNYLVIRFPWRRCTVWYTARVPYPNYIVGYACGTYVVCRRTYGRNYSCRY